MGHRRLGSTNGTLWNLLVPLGVLLVGAAAGYWLSELGNAARYREVENELAKLRRELAGERRSEDAAELQAYYKQMTRLLLERDLRASAADGEEQELARARTLAVVADADAEGNRGVTRFLTNMDFVTTSDSVRLLSQAHLADAELRGAFLPAADLSASLLRGADLRGALLTSANLGGADLRDADLRGADLEYANLQDAELEGARLGGADLTRANLEGATVSGEQLDSCGSLKGATLPDGSKHD